MDTQKKVGLWASKGVGFGDFLSSSEVEIHLGRNSGNLLFWNAAKGMIANEQTFMMDTVNKFPTVSEANDKFDIIFMPCANHLDPNILSEGLVKYLKYLTIPVAICGIGVQAQLGRNIKSLAEDFLKHKHCSDFISILNEKSTCISTRGSSSSDFLQAAGYKGEIYTTGCPSQTFNPNPNLGKTISSNLDEFKRSRHFDRLSIVHNLATKWCEHLHSVDNHIEKLFVEFRNIQIQQSGGKSHFENHLDKCSSTLNFLEDNESQDKAYKTGIIFSNLESWAASISNSSFSIGTRIHGSLMSTQLGIPSLTIAHDTRVAELCQTTGLSHVPIGDFLKYKDITGLLDAFEFDAAIFDKVRINNCATFKKFINKAGLIASKKIENLIHEI